jgi:hypothetical protein
MIDYTYDSEEGTLLLPTETHWRCEAWLLNTDHLLQWNKFDEYSFSFHPQTMSEHQMLFETIDMAKMLVEMRQSRFSSKVRVSDKSSYERQGTLYCSQLFAPKLNIKVDHPDQLRERLVSISGHIRDTKDGRVYLQADYIDCYAIDDGEPEIVVAPVSTDTEDW